MPAPVPARCSALPRPSWRWNWLCGLVFLALSPLAQAGGTIFTRKYSDKVEITIESVFGAVAAGGYAPMRVTLRNTTPLDLTWDLSYTGSTSFRSGQARAIYTLQAPAGSGESVHEIFFPFLRESNGWSNYALRISCSGLGVDSTNQSANTPSDWRQVAISQSLASRNAATLTTEAQSARSSSSHSGSVEFAETYTPNHLPSDWRGYTGLDLLMITDTEWTSLSPSQRSAVLEWLRIGGNLFVFTQDADAAGALKRLGLASRRSLGSCAAFSWNGRDLVASQVVAATDRLEPFLRDPDEGPSRALSHSEWPLAEVLGPGVNNPIVVVLILLAFAIMVGPVNLFVFARPGFRHRLFVTIPAISLAASLLLLLGILVTDGLGGQGRRIAFVDLQPGSGERRAYVIQQQICHTGILLGGSFALEEGATLTPLKLNTTFAGDRGFEFDQKGQRFSGNLFQSRSDQGLEITVVRPTRARLERRAAKDAAAPPVLFSSLDFTLDGLFFVAADGVWRHDGKLESGGEAALVKATEEDLRGWWADHGKPFDEEQRKRFQALVSQAQPGEFFAFSTDSRLGWVETLRGIRWSGDTALIHGSLPEPETPAVVP